MVLESENYVANNDNLGTALLSDSYIRIDNEDNDNYHHHDDNDLQITNKKNHFASSLITATSNFSVQYNFQSISVALLVMSTSECTSTVDNCKKGNQAEWVTGTATATVFAGAIAGQLIMGYAGDVLGRNKAMLFTLTLASFGALLSALISFGDPELVYSLIITCRFILGIGLGGVYPLSATKAAENSSESSGHGSVTNAAWSFFWQCPGAMTPWLIAYIFTFINMSTSLKWRLILGLGFLPGIVVAVSSYYDNPEVIVTNSSSSSIIKSKIDIIEYLGDPIIRRKLIVTGGGWFLYDICYYGVNLFGGQIIDAMSTSEDDDISANSSIRWKSSKQLIAQSTAIPACIITIILFRYVGIEMIHNGGFILIAICFIIMAASFDYLKENNPDGLFTLYCFLLFSLSSGPNVTTFVLPSQSFPREIRATFNGISAAMGKMGAVAGAYIYGSVAAATSFVVVMIICAILAFIGAIISYIWFPEEKPSYILIDDEEKSEKR